MLTTRDIRFPLIKSDVLRPRQQLHHHIIEGTPQYFNIVAKLPSMTSVWDKKTWTQYAYFDNGGLVSFDNENAICAKVQYAIENNLAGFIIWELSGDLMDDLSTPLLDITNKKLMNPDLSCGEPGIYPEEGGDLQIDQGVPPTPGTPPTPSSPSSSSGYPESSAAGHPTTSTDASAIGQPATSSNSSAVGQPVTSSEASSVGRPSTVFLCGSQQSAFNVADSKSLDLSFWYELHSDASVPKLAVLKEVKGAMMTSLADQLRCAGSSSRLRSLSGHSLVASKDYVKAIESAPTDVPQNRKQTFLSLFSCPFIVTFLTRSLFAVPCSIKIRTMDVPTVCYSIVGRLTARFGKETPDAVINEVKEELLFSIRMDMVLGTYESAIVKQVIYGDLLESDITPSNSATASQTQSEQSEGGVTSMAIAILFSAFAIVLLGVLLFVFRKRRRPQTKPSEEVIPPTETWRMSLGPIESWRKAHKSLEIYDDNSNRLAVNSDEIRDDNGTGYHEEAIEVESTFHGKHNRNVEEGQKTMKMGKFMRFMRSVKDTKKADMHVSQRDSEMNIIDADKHESEGRGQSFGISEGRENPSTSTSTIGEVAYVKDEVEGINLPGTIIAPYQPDESDDTDVGGGSRQSHGGGRPSLDHHGASERSLASHRSAAGHQSSSSHRSAQSHRSNAGSVRSSGSRQSRATNGSHGTSGSHATSGSHGTSGQDVYNDHRDHRCPSGDSLHSSGRSRLALYQSDDTDVEDEVEGNDPPHTDSFYQVINGTIMALRQSVVRDSP